MTTPHLADVHGVHGGGGEHEDGEQLPGDPLELGRLRLPAVAQLRERRAHLLQAVERRRRRVHLTHFENIFTNYAKSVAPVP